MGSGVMSGRDNNGLGFLCILGSNGQRVDQPCVGKGKGTINKSFTPVPVK